ncbi:hypothetical protein AAC387_Pa10g1026 [Persea americana]
MKPCRVILNHVSYKFQDSGDDFYFVVVVGLWLAAPVTPYRIFLVTSCYDLWTCIFRPFGHFLHKLMDIIFKGRPWVLVKNKVRKDHPSIQLTTWKFWPIVGWVNYQYVPLQFRVLFHSLLLHAGNVSH